MCEHKTLIGECCRGSELTRHESQHPDDPELGNQIERFTVKKIQLFHRDKHNEGVDRFKEWEQTRDSKDCKISLYENSAENPWDSVLHLSLDDHEDPKYFCEFLRVPEGSMACVSQSHDFTYRASSNL